MTHGDLLAVALLLDLWWGDPRWLPHPVSLIARFARLLEKMTRRLFPPKIAGITTAGLVVATTGLTVWSMIRFSSGIHSYLGDVVKIYLLYTCLATKSLVQHAQSVMIPLERSDLETARAKVAMMVGRDTKDLDEGGIIRATLESVGENTVDGIGGPMLFALAGGPVAAMVYKATSTLDSLFGYQNERYRTFGWASARLDDLLAWLPARLTGPTMILTGLLPGYRLRHGIRIYRRDRRKHPSPNAAHGESALAGLLGIQLGGPSTYQGVPSHKAFLGTRLEPLNLEHIRRANRLVMITALLLTGGGWCFWRFSVQYS